MATRQIIGYKWNNEAASRSGQNAARVHYGVPVNAQAVTREWIQPVHNTGVSGDFWYWKGDLSPVFGSPSVFNIDEPDEI